MFERVGLRRYTLAGWRPFVVMTKRLAVVIRRRDTIKDKGLSGLILVIRKNERRKQRKDKAKR